MTNKLDSFDPIVFLEINTVSQPSQSIEKLRNELMTMMGEYVLHKLITKLSDEQAKELMEETDGSKIFSALSTLVPNLGNEIQEELENFKLEYNKVIM